MRIASYVLAVVIAVAAAIVGFATKVWLLAGFGVGFLGVAIYRIAVAGSGRVEGQDDSIFAIFDMPIWPDGVISIAIIVVAELLVLLIFKLLNWV